MNIESQPQKARPHERAPMSAAGSALFFLAAGTGFWVLADANWGFALKAMLFAHPALSIAATLWVFAFTLKKARAQFMPHPWARLLWAPGGAAALLLWLMLTKGREFIDRPWFVWLCVLAVFAVSVYCLRHPEDAPDTPRGRYYFFSGGLVWAAWLALSFTGAAILLVFQSSNIIPLADMHRYAAYALSALFIAHLYAVRPLLGPDVRAAVPVGRSVKVGILAALAGVAVGAAISAFSTGARWVVPLNTFPLEKRPASEREWKPSGPVSDAQLDELEVTESCGNTGGCHKEIVAEHVKSLHNITVHPAYFQVNLSDMSREIGPRNQLICAGCHYPAGALDRRKDFAYFKTRNNFSCVVCHSITGAGIDSKDKKRSWYEVSPPWAHMGMFPTANGEVSAADRFFIRLNAAGHRRAFKRKLHSEDAYCTACHHLQMPPPTTPGLTNPRCILCHMQPQKIFGGPTNKKSHLFAGANPAGALLTGDNATADIIERFARGEIVPSLKGWETLWSVRYSSADPIKSVPWIMLTFYYNIPPRPGEDFRLYVISTNTGLGHNFPSGPLDLSRAWLEFHATDSRGREFCGVGATAPPDGPLPKDRPALGGYMMGLDGKLLTRNRVWQVEKKAVERQIPNNMEITDSITCRIPPGSTGGIHITARWNYRKLSQEFIDYCYGPGKVAAPQIVAGKAEKDIPINVEKKVFPPDVGY